MEYSLQNTPSVRGEGHSSDNILVRPQTALVLGTSGGATEA